MRKSLIFGAIITIAVGLPYLFGLFAPLEVAYTYQGKISLVAGLILLFLSWFWDKKRLLISGALLSGYAAVALLQVIPVWFWFSYGISRGPVTYWIYAVPHLVLFGLGAFIVFRIFEMWRPAINNKQLTWIGSLGIIAIGLAYVFYLFGPQEAEVAQWGRIAIILGITLLILSWILGEIQNLLSKLILGLGFFGAAVLQVPAVVLWLTLRVATDNTPPPPLAVAGLITLPHLLLFVVCAFVVFRIFKDKPSSPVPAV